MASHRTESRLDLVAVDLRWLSPLDDATLIDLAKALKRVVGVHEANLTGGFGAEIAARLAERAFGELAAPVLRVATPDVRMPAAPELQAALLPSRSTIGDAVRTLVKA